VGADIDQTVTSIVPFVGAMDNLNFPICVNLLQADKIVDKAKEKEVRVAVHHQG